MARILFFFTSSFPYGTNETFIESEISYVSASFDSVVIVTNSTLGKLRTIPDNITIEHIPYNVSKTHRLRSLRELFSVEFWREIRTINRRYKQPLRYLHIATALISLEKMKITSSHIRQLMHAHTQPADSVYAYSYWANDMALTLAYMQKQKFFTKAITRAHGWDVYFEANKANYLPYRALLLQHIDAVWCISRAGAEYYTKKLYEYNSKIHVSYLGVAQRKATLQQTTRPFVIISVSNLIPVKRIDLLIESLELLSIPTRWLHFGDGPLQDEIHAMAEEKLARHSHISYEFKGRVSNTEVCQYLEREHLSVLINVSSSEGIPVSMMEALSCGIPIIGTSVGGVPEIIEDGKNGFLLEPTASSSSIAHSITRMALLSADEYNAMRQHAYNTWSTKFDAAKNFPHFIKDAL